MMAKSRRRKRQYLSMPFKDLGYISKPWSPETSATGRFDCLKNDFEDEIIEEEVAGQKSMDEKGKGARHICAVERRREITMDSAAEASVCPPEWGEELFGLEAAGEENKLKLINASGGTIPHHGSREALFKTKVTSEDKSEEDKLMSMGFEVCDVKKALAAVWKVCERATWSNSVSWMARGFITKGEIVCA